MPSITSPSLDSLGSDSPATALPAVPPAWADWQSVPGSAQQLERRKFILTAMCEASAAGEDSECVELDLPQDLGRLELPPASALREAEWLTPRLVPCIDFSEPIGRESLCESFDALGVTRIAASRMDRGGLPSPMRLDKLQVLDLSMTQGEVNMDAVLAGLSGLPALRTISLPCGQRAPGYPAGWSYDATEHRLTRTRETAAVPMEPAPGEVHGDRDINRFFHDLKTLLKASTAVDPGIRRGHKHRLKDVQVRLAQRPDMNADVRGLLSQQSGSCVDAGLRRLDDIDMLLHCGRLTAMADAGPASLRLALFRRADQSQAVGRRDDSENIERANALRVLIDQRVNTYLGGCAMPLASAPVYARLAGLRDVAPGATPGPGDWPADLREAADAVFQGEIEEGFPSLQLLLAEEEGAGALIAGLLTRDPAYQATADSLEAAFQRDYAAAQDADPDNPMAGIELHAAKEQALAQRRFELLAPWTGKLADQVRGHLSELTVDSTRAD